MTSDRKRKKDTRNEAAKSGRAYQSAFQAAHPSEPTDDASTQEHEELHELFNDDDSQTDQEASSSREEAPVASPSDEILTELFEVEDMPEGVPAILDRPSKGEVPYVLTPSGFASELSPKLLAPWIFRGDGAAALFFKALRKTQVPNEVSREDDLPEGLRVKVAPRTFVVNQGGKGAGRYVRAGDFFALFLFHPSKVHLYTIRHPRAQSGAKLSVDQCPHPAWASKASSGEIDGIKLVYRRCEACGDKTIDGAEEVVAPELNAKIRRLFRALNDRRTAQYPHVREKSSRIRFFKVPAGPKGAGGIVIVGSAEYLPSPDDSVDYGERVRNRLDGYHIYENVEAIEAAYLETVRYCLVRADEHIAMDLAFKKALGG
jgi:hypothetical protein